MREIRKGDWDIAEMHMKLRNMHFSMGSTETLFKEENYDHHCRPHKQKIQKKLARGKFEVATEKRRIRLMGGAFMSLDFLLFPLK